MTVIPFETSPLHALREISPQLPRVANYSKRTLGVSLELKNDNTRQTYIVGENIAKLKDLEHSVHCREERYLEKESHSKAEYFCFRVVGVRMKAEEVTEPVIKILHDLYSPKKILFGKKLSDGNVDMLFF